MLAWLFGAENSFFRALIYNIFTFILLTIFGVLVFGVTTLLPMLVSKFAEKK